MRVSVPERFQLKHVLLFMAFIFVGQQLEGTGFIFSLLSVAYIGIFSAAYNVSGGMEYTSGAFILFNGILTVLLGLFLKVFLLEPADNSLRAPKTTMLCYCVGMTGMWLAALLSRGLRPSVPFIKDFESLARLKQASIVCLVLGLLLVLAGGGSDTSSGSVVSAVRQINSFPTMAIVFGTIYALKESNGRRATNWIVLTGLAINVGFGLMYFSKQGMLIGPTAWFLTCVVNRFDFRKLQLAGFVLASAFVVYYLVPYSQYVRVYSTNSKSANTAIALKYLANLNETRRLYLETLDDYDLSTEAHFFEERETFLDRAIMFSADDAIIDYTNKGHIFGLLPTYMAYVNVVPHFIWRSKPEYDAGNAYANELGWLPEGDTTTGVSFSAAAEAYHQAGWAGLLLLLPVNMFLGFIVTDSLAGSARFAPWAMLWIIDVTHIGPEGGIGAPVYLATYGVVAMAFLVLVTKHIAPSILSVFKSRGFSSGSDFPASSHSQTPTANPLGRVGARGPAL